jgi:hypothetical protein
MAEVVKQIITNAEMYFWRKKLEHPDETSDPLQVIDKH